MSIPFEQSMRVPFLSESAKEAPTPDAFMLTLYAHQGRALHQMLAIERDPTFLSSTFSGSNLGTFLDYSPRGGCLCDSVGLGKTATVLAMIVSEDRDTSMGPNLLVAPTHLLHQWRTEAIKFCQPDSIRVIVGLAEYLQASSMDNRTLVLIDAAEVVSSPRVWYDFRKIYSSQGGDQLIPASTAELERIRKQAHFISGPYKGWIHTTEALFCPRSGFRRVLFDEVQDLVDETRDEKDCLLQLTTTATNVWLITATPFPRAWSSVYANHQILGFHRLQLNPNGHGLDEGRLHPSHPFELIKRKLYIRSPALVRQLALKSITTKVEQRLFDLNQIERSLYTNAINEFAPDGSTFPVWSPELLNLRASITHLAASESTREMLAVQDSKRRRVVPTALSLAMLLGGVATLAERLLGSYRTKLIERIHKRGDYNERVVPALDHARAIADDFLVHIDKYSIAPAGLSFSSVNDRDPFPPRSFGAAPSKAWLMTYMKSPLVRVGKLDRGGDSDESAKILTTWKTIKTWFAANLTDRDQVERLLSTTAVGQRRTARFIEQNDAQIELLQANIAALKAGLDAGHDDIDQFPLSLRYGGKINALIQFIRTEVAADEKVILFSGFDSMLEIVVPVLNSQSIRTVHLAGDGQRKRDALAAFVNPDGNLVQVLAMSSITSPSGTNLQCASHVVILDPPGSTAIHSATLVLQAIGRAVRLGQTRPVRITYLVAKDTIEQALTDSIISQIADLQRPEEDASYRIDQVALDLPDPVPVPAKKSFADQLQDLVHLLSQVEKEDGEVGFVQVYISEQIGLLQARVDSYASVAVKVEGERDQVSAPAPERQFKKDPYALDDEPLSVKVERIEGNSNDKHQHCEIDMPKAKRQRKVKVERNREDY